ncbi:Long-chain-fatty-acid--CoA ligase [Mycolicibacterium rhodesiae JS60]|nr:Long-chain-fatty-acid--CoA ligase [Mycolicibacterium rhodesiae JS60]
MMDIELSLWLLLDRAREQVAGLDVVTYDAHGRREYTYGDLARRAMQLMHSLDRLEVAEGDRIATLAGNSDRHLEAFFGIPCSGRVIHPLNPRMSADELAYVINDADDKVIMADAAYLPLIESVRDRIPGVKDVISFTESPASAALPNLLTYDELLAAEPTDYPRKAIEERSPLGICYTTGTTGRPKGVVYTHRSTMLQAFAASTGAALAIGPGDCLAAQVPMFHANAGAIPHAATLVGVKQVLFGGSFDAAAFLTSLKDERATVSMAVPTIWLAVADQLAATGTRLPYLRHVISGGSRPQRALIERYRDEFGITMIQGMGITEGSGFVAAGWPQERMRDWKPDEVLDEVQMKAGLPIPGVRVKLLDDDGVAVPHDGSSMGHLYLRGPWIADEYLNGQSPDSFTEDGWFRTGDIATCTESGYLALADRSKDLIKSGGEWISSIDMENSLVAMTSVAEAAVIAVPDPMWAERPLACIKSTDGQVPSLEELHQHLLGAGFPKWQLPDRVEYLSEIPKTTVGKTDKKALRAMFAG